MGTKRAIISFMPKIQDMINFSSKNNNWKIRLKKRVDPSYQKNFTEALLNLELNLQEERIRSTLN